MSTQDFKGREILVKVKKTPADQAGRKRRGQAPPIKPPDDFLPRRNKSSNKIYIRPFDLGRLADGSDIDFAFGYPPTLTLTDSGGGFVGYRINVAADYAAAWNAYILAEFASWETGFFEINSSELYRQYAINIAGDGAAYEAGKGFRAAGGPTQTHGNAFRTFDVLDAGHYKITADQDFGSADADFTLDADAKVFMVPTLPTWFGQGFVDSGSDHFDYLLNGFRRPFPRSFFISNAAWETQFGHPAFAGDVFWSGVPPRPVYPSALRDAWRLAFVADPKSYLIKVKYFISFFARFWVSDTAPAATTFPTLITPGVLNSPASSPSAGPPTVQAIDDNVPAGLLVAAIKKGSDWFYVWNRSANVANVRGLYQLTV